MRLSKSEIKELIISFFPNLKEKEVDIFLSITEYYSAKNKEIILKSEKTDKNVILILKGVARAFLIDIEGNDITHFIRAKGRLIGDANVFGNEIQRLSIESIGEIHYLKFDISKLEELGYDNPELMRFYVGFLKEIILTLSYRLHSFVAMTSEERYLDLIKWNPTLIENAFDKHIASFLGITPLTIHRIKKKQKVIK